MGLVCSFYVGRAMAETNTSVLKFCMAPAINTSVLQFCMGPAINTSVLQFCVAPAINTSVLQFCKAPAINTSVLQFCKAPAIKIHAACVQIISCYSQNAITKNSEIYSVQTTFLPQW